MCRWTQGTVTPVALGIQTVIYQCNFIIAAQKTGRYKYDIAHLPEKYDSNNLDVAD